jgi:glycosyltransferase involved in cell wall biosynthesis
VITDGLDGILVPGGDVAAMVDALRTLIGHPELRHRFGAAGYAKTASEYSGASFRRNLEAILDVLLAKASTPGN